MPVEQTNDSAASLLAESRSRALGSPPLHEGEDIQGEENSFSNYSVR